MLNIALALIAALPAAAPEPLLLPDGEPVVAAYFFTRWWEPWRSDDDRVRADIQILDEAGVNVLLIDHQPSQMFGEAGWSWFDRDHKLAAERGLYIVPWLESKCGRDASIADRFDEIARRWDVRLERAEQQDGTPAETLMWKPEFTTYMMRWIGDYLERYGEDGALLRVVRDGQEYRVISPCVELGWGEVSFDDETNALFREWVTKHYDNIDSLNAAWGTAYPDFGAIDPRDKEVFDYSDLRQPTQSPAVTDHTRFRTELVRDVYQGLADALKAEYPDLLLMAELPYEFPCDHTDALKYSWEYAAFPEIAEWADLLLIRTTGDPSDASLAHMRDWAAERDIAIILTHRVAADQGPTDEARTFAKVRSYALDAANYASGFGYYSWNEMVDTHIAPNYPETTVPDVVAHWSVTIDKSFSMTARVARLNQAYREALQRLHE